MILLVYGFTSLGATLNLHYCMDEFVGWSLLDKNDDACGKCGMESKDEGCCKDEHKQLQLKADYQKSSASDYNRLATPVTATPLSLYAFEVDSLRHEVAISKAPPGIREKRLYLLYSVFII